MINIKRFRNDTKTSLRLKGYIRDVREKKLFYLEHSRFARYTDSEYLNVFLEELLDYSNSWTRLGQKNMNPEKNPASEGHANARIYHSIDVSENARTSSRELLLNELLSRTGGLIHDLSHTAFAHEGELIISNYLRKHGICTIYHGALVPLSFALENIHEKVLKRLEQIKDRPLNPKELEKYHSTYLDICDIAVCHNGESTAKEIQVDNSKSDSTIENEWIDVLTLNKTSKEVKNRTKEGAIILLCDPISYVGKDFKDGVIKHLIDVNDPEYEALFIKMGLSKEQLDEWALGKYDKKTEIVRWVTRRLRDDLIENSKLINGAQMSNTLLKLMYELRSLNYTKVIIPGQRKINSILRSNIGPLIDYYSKILVENPSLENTDTSNPYIFHIIDNLNNQSPSVVELYQKIVKKGIETSINTDIKKFLNNSSGETNRFRRISEDLSKLQEVSPITDEVKQKYIDNILKEIYLSPQDSKKLFEKRIRAKYPNASNEDLTTLMEENSYMHLETFEESMAKLRVAIYLGESTNDFLLAVMESHGLLTQEDRKLRYISGGSVEGSSIAETIRAQEAKEI